MIFKVNNIKELEQYFGKQFYCRPFYQNVVVLLGPVTFKLCTTTITSCKSSLILHKCQEGNDTIISDVKFGTYSSMKLTFHSTVVSRLKGGERGMWKHEVANLIMASMNN